MLDRNETEKKRLNFWIIALAALFFVSSFLFLNDIMLRVRSAELNDELQQTAQTDDALQNDGETTIPSISELKQINPDIVGWIIIKGTNINYPLLQCSNNEYYLDHAYNEEYNDAGSIFLDYRNADDFTDQNTVIYGHSRLDGTMFYELKQFRSQEFSDEYPIVMIVTEQNVFYYQIFSVDVVDATAEYRNSDYGSGFTSYIKMMRNASFVESSASVDAQSRIITLSTCTESLDDGRLAVLAVLLNPNGEEIDLSAYGF